MSTEIVIKLRAYFMCQRKAALMALAIVTLGISAALVPFHASAQQETAHVFSGKVLVDGAEPENGAKLTAWIDGRRIGEARVRRGTFRIVILQRGDAPFAGKRVSFRLGDREFQRTAIWKAGGTSELALSIGGNEPSLSGKTFVGEEPLVCDIFRVQDVLEGMIRNETRSTSSRIRATLKQAGCRMAGEFKIVSPSLNGSGPLHGTVDGNFVRFTVPVQTNDAREDLNFSGIINGDRIAGQFHTPRTKETGEWILLTKDAAPSAIVEWIRQIEFVPPSVLSEAGSKLERQAATVNPEQDRSGDGAESAAASRVAKPDPANLEKSPSSPNGETARAEPERTEEQRKRGFFFNSISSDPNSLNKAMDPTTLAVIGILITLAGTTVQLIRGN